MFPPLMGSVPPKTTAPLADPLNGGFGAYSGPVHEGDNWRDSVRNYFGSLATSPFALMGMGMLGNEGHLTPGIMQTALMGAQQGMTKEKMAEEQKRYDAEQKRKDKARRDAERLLKPYMDAPRSAQAMAGGADPQQMYLASLANAYSTPPVNGPPPPPAGAMPPGGPNGPGAMPPPGAPPPSGAFGPPPTGAMPPPGAFGPRGGAPPQSLPFGQIRQPRPFDGAPATAGAPAGAPNPFALAVALMGGSDADRASGVNLLSAALASARKPVKRHITKDKDGFVRDVESREYLFGKPGPGEAMPFAGVEKPTGPQAGIREMYNAFVDEHPQVRGDQKFATKFGAAFEQLERDKPSLLVGPDIAKVIADRAKTLLGEFGALAGGAQPKQAAAASGNDPFAPGAILSKAPNEAQTKMELAAPALFRSITTIDTLEDRGFDPSTWEQTAVNTIPGRYAQKALSQLGLRDMSHVNKSQEFAVARKTFADELARIKSGAVIKDEEILNEIHKYLPGLEDTYPTRVNKRVKRTEAMVRFFDMILRTKNYSGAEGIAGLQKMRDQLADVVLPRAEATQRSVNSNILVAGSPDIGVDKDVLKKPDPVLGRKVLQMTPAEIDKAMDLP